MKSSMQTWMLCHRGVGSEGMQLLPSLELKVFQNSPCTALQKSIVSGGSLLNSENPFFSSQALHSLELQIPRYLFCTEVRRLSTPRLCKDRLQQWSSC